MKTVTVSSILDAPLDKVREQVSQPKLLQYVARGWLTFEPIDPPTFGETWEAREYRVRMKWRGVLPIGEQIIGIEFPPPKDGRYFVRDNGRSASIRKWDHLMTIEPTGDGRTAYEDRLDLDAGWRTPFVAAFARAFYAHRQGRWARLIDNGFDYSA